MKKELKFNQKFNKIIEKTPDLNNLTPIFVNMFDLQIPEDLINTITNISNLIKSI